MSNKKNILHVRHSIGDGGITTLVEALVDLNQSSSATHQILVWKDSPKPGHESNVIDMSASTNRKKDFAEIVKTYDTIFVHSLMPFMMKSLLKKKSNVYLFQHGITLGQGTKKLFKQLYYFLAINVFKFKIVCSSNYAKEKLLSKVSVFDKKQILIVGFGIDVNVKRTPLEPTDSVLRIGFAGRLVDQKRVSRIINALEHIKHTVPIEFHIAGNGPLFSQLQHTSQEFKNTKIEFVFHGFLENMDDFYSKLDVFILPSVGESFGLVVLEAIFRNIPTIVFADSGACVEFIEEGSSGYIVNNELELAQKLEDLNNISLRKELRLKMNEMNLSDYDIVNTRAKLDLL